MAEEDKSNGDSMTSLILGFILIGLVIFGIYKGIVWIVGAFKGPPPVVSVSLSAYFTENPNNAETSQRGANLEPKNPQLTIKGEVRKNGVPIKQGNARISVKKEDSSFEQIISIDLKESKFELADPSLAAVAPDDELYILAEISSPDFIEPASQELYLNTKPPTLTGMIAPWLAAAILLIIASVFFYAFTGRKTPAKNQVAIIFSYCIIAIFLAIALLAPVLLLRAFPNARRAMIGAPAGLIVTPITLQQETKTQWAVNIGGYSYIPKRSSSQSKAAASPTPSPTRAQSPERPSPQPTPTAAPPPAASPAAAIANQSPSPAGSPAATARTASPSPSVSPTPGAPAITAEALKDIEGSEDVALVDGGLVIPLYVVVLSIIGGAINMTRKVPQLQGEGEQSELTLPKPGVSAAGRRMRALFPWKRASSTQKTKPVGEQGATETPDPAASGQEHVSIEAEVKKQKDNAAEQAAVIDSELQTLVEEQSERNIATTSTMDRLRKQVDAMRNLYNSKKEGESLLGYITFEDWLARRPRLKELLYSHWRVELLSQYMYLISAPFLAIVAYYMLDLGGLTKQPVLVLISFSVGLVSEKILSWLLGMAKGYLPKDNKGQPAA
jgi:hypothetical protein